MGLEVIPSFFLAMGLIFDFMSLFALITTILSRKFSSGMIPGLALIGYALFMLCTLEPAMRGRLLLNRVLWLVVVLTCFHVSLHWFHWRIEKRLRAKRKEDNNAGRWRYL